MLDRLFEEGRLNNEYRSAFEHAAYALLREEGKMEVIERTVYKKLCKYLQQSFFYFQDKLITIYSRR